MRRLLPLLVCLLLVACGTDEGGAAEETGPTSPEPSYTSREQVRSDFRDGGEDYQAELELGDGRTVSMYYAEGKGLGYQLRASGGTLWTAPAYVHETDEEPCQGIELVEAGGTVAVAADWGRFCYDGEPPTESLAAVGTGDLTGWAVEITDDFDGWEDLTVSDDGDEARWTYLDFELGWSRDGGFGQVQ